MLLLGHDVPGDPHRARVLRSAALVSIRYLISGGIMLAGARLSGAKIPSGAELRRTALYGV